MRELRYERKYLLSGSDYRSISMEIMIHPAGFRIQHPDRRIRNIYFDTPELAALNTNLYGVAERAKHRVRWYGNEILPKGRARWEIKQKHNTLGLKIVKDINLSEDTSFEKIATDVNARFCKMQALIPTLLNTYMRSYFVTPDNKFRITVDREMNFAPIIAGKRTTSIPFRVSNIVVELKYDKDWDDDANEILKYIPFRQTRNSKYVTGMLMSV
jgi:SPX domain protein involved in polyphosphate accumulation